GESSCFQIGWGTTKTDDISKENRVLGDVCCKKEIGRRELIRVSIRGCLLAFYLQDPLRCDGCVDTNLHTVLCLILQRLLDLFVNGLAAINPLTLICDSLLRALFGLVVDVVVPVDVDGCFLSSRFGL